jgi:hypothetical protein
LSTLIQRSFSSGEISSSLYARVDLTKYATGLKACRNFIVQKHGGAANRSGTKFIGEVKDSTKTVRLLDFVFNADQTYILEFGDEYMRVIRDGSYQYDLTLNITNVTNANPAVVTYTGTDPSNGDEVYISGISSAIAQYLNGRNFKIANVNGGANTFELQYMDGTNVDSTSFGAYLGGSGGTAKRVYTVTSPYDYTDLKELQYVQSADVITFAHPDYPVYQLSRTGHTSWTFALASFVPSVSRPTGGATASITAGGNTYRYRVTAVAEETFEESLPGYEATRSISAISTANPAVVTTGAAHGYTTGDQVYFASIAGTGGVTNLNGNTYNVTVLTPTTFSVDGVNGAGFAYSGSGTVARTYIRVDSAAVATAADPHQITWTAVSGAAEYNVYKEESGVYGFIGTAAGTGSTITFNDIGVSIDTEDTPPAERNPFNSTDNYPSCVTYYQQRLIFANTNNDPEKVWTSRTGLFTNFSVSSPIQDDDAVTFTIAGRQVNEVRHVLDLGKLIAFTASGEWAINGNDSGTLKPTEVNPKQHSYNGSAVLPPIVIDGTALFLQARNGVIRDLAFDYQVDGYRGNDLTIFAQHLFEGKTIEDWTFQQIPNSTVWCVRSDGVLLGLTYVREHQVLAWHRHDFDGGTIENVKVIPEGNEDVLYCVVKRTVNNKTVRYVERFNTRVIYDEAVEDATFMDSYLTYDGRSGSAAHVMVLSGGTSWGNDEYLLLSSEDGSGGALSYFDVAGYGSDIGNEIHLELDGEIVRCEIVQDLGNSPTEVMVRPNRTVPVSMRNVEISSWSKAVDEVTGLWHLEGKTVSIFADAYVVGSPNNPSYDQYVVTNGTVTLPRHYAVIHVGLPFTSDIETLNIDSPQGETIADKKPIVQTVNVFVEKTRGLWAGVEEPTEDMNMVGVGSGLREFKVRASEGYDDPVAIKTGTMDVPVQGNYNNNGRVFIRQVDPLPATVLAIAPAGLYPFRG